MKIKLRNCASCWLLLYEYITKHDPQNVKYNLVFFKFTISIANPIKFNYIIIIFDGEHETQLYGMFSVFLLRLPLRSE